MLRNNLKCFLLSRSVLFFLSILFLSNIVFATEIIVDDESAQEHLPQITETNFGIPQVDIVNSEYGISYNKIKKFSVGAKGVVINNSDSPKAVEGRGVVGPNDNLTQPADIIVLEVTGACSSELQGPITVVGSKAKVVLSNPNGITCNGCEFINSNEVIIRTDKLRSVEKGEARWERDLYGEVNIGSNGGITVSNGSLVLSAGKIKIAGEIFSDGMLQAEAHFVMDDREENKLEIKNEDMQYIIDIASPAKIAAEKIYLIAAGRGGVRISNSFLSDEDVARMPVELKANKDKVYIEAKNGDFNVDAETIVKGSFKFVGKNFKNQEKLKANNIELNLSKSFINNKDGEVIIENRFQAKSDHFVNDNGGYIGAGSIKVYLTGKMEDKADENKNGKSLYQGSNSILESREGSMELVAPEGGMYFGYKKALTGAGDDKDGFIFVGSQLLSPEGEIYIQSGGDVVFDGTQIQGDIKVEAKGEITKNSPTIRGAYKDGTHNIVVEEERVRMVTHYPPCVPVLPHKSLYQYIRNHYEWYFHNLGCDEDRLVAVCNGIASQSRSQLENTVKTAGVPINVLADMVLKYRIAQDEYSECQKGVLVKETYTEKTTQQVSSLQDVSLNADFIGGVQFFSNNEGLVFNEESSFLNEEDNADYLSFVSEELFYTNNHYFYQEYERYF